MLAHAQGRETVACRGADALTWTHREIVRVGASQGPETAMLSVGQKSSPFCGRRTFTGLAPILALSSRARGFARDLRDGVTKFPRVV
jgi:hypothetical protein